MSEKTYPESIKEASDELDDAALSIEELLAIMARLRDPQQGCPWDLQQTFATIVPYTIEEAYEIAEAVSREDYDELRDELGDLLLQVVFHSRMAQEQKLFDFNDVVTSICAKMVRRHPHVFAQSSQADGGVDIRQVKQNWEAIKSAELEKKGKPRNGALDGVPEGLDALLRAAKIQKRAASTGFDWQETAPVLEQVYAELEELGQAMESANQDAVEDEFGDVLFSLVNLSRHLKLDSGMALRRATEKFKQRFQQMETLAQGAGQTLQMLEESELENLWQQAKQQLTER